MNNDEYTCDVCHRTFKKGWSSEEALLEANENFENCKQEDCGIVCDDCYEIMQRTYPFNKFNEDQRQ